MSDPFNERPLPRAALVSAALLVVLALLSAAGSRWTGLGTTKLSDDSVAQVLNLHFADADDGSINITNAFDPNNIVKVEAGSGGFIRGVMRSFSRARKSQGIGPENPYQLRRSLHGRLSLVDPATLITVDLDPFGPTNAGSFASLFVAMAPQTASVSELAKR